MGLVVPKEVGIELESLCVEWCQLYSVDHEEGVDIVHHFS